MRRHLMAVVAVPLLAAGCTTGSARPPAPTPAPPVSAPPVSAPRVGAGAGGDRTGRSTPVADPIYPQRGNPALDVLHYGLDLSWAPVTRMLTGTATLRIRPVTDAGEIRLDFQPYTLDQVSVDGAAARSRVSGQKLIVPVAVTQDRAVTLVVRYHGRPATTPMPSHRSDVEPLGLTIAKDGSLWTMQEPFGSFTWYPSNDQPSDEALYDIAITVPPGWTGIAGGTPAGRTGNTFRYRSTDPVATYLQTLAVGRYREITDTGPHQLPLTYWYRPATTDDKLVPIMKNSPKYLKFLEQRFGPYPFPTGGIVLVDSASGMETQQMITMGGRVKDLSPDALEGYGDDLLHEYAHQWFGDSVTPTTWRDLWLNEGWAMYAQLLYQQQKNGYTDDDMENDLRASDTLLRRKIGPPGTPKPDSFAESNVYVCPALMLKKLNDALGDDKFFALARAWVQTQKDTQQDRASFIAFVNRQTGRDYTTLINTWLDSPTTPAA
jgi:aminopeptidase N